MAEEITNQTDDVDENPIGLADLGLSPKEALFVEAFANPESETFGRCTASAELAKYSSPQNAAWKLRQRPRVQIAIQRIHDTNAKDIGRVLADLEHQRIQAEAKGDWSTAVRASELQLKRLGALLDRNIVSIEQPDEIRKYTEAERREAKRIAKFLLKDPTEDAQ